MTSQEKLKVPKCRTELFKNTCMYLWNILPNNLRTTNVNLGQFRKSCWNYYKTFSYDPDRPHASWTAYVIEFMCIYFLLLFHIFFFKVDSSVWFLFFPSVPSSLYLTY